MRRPVTKRPDPPEKPYPVEGVDKRRRFVSRYNKFKDNAKKVYNTARKVAPYVGDAAAGYMSGGVPGAVTAVGSRLLREYLPMEFTNNANKRRESRRNLRQGLNGYAEQRRRDRAKIDAVHNVRFPAIQDQAVDDEPEISILEYCVC